MEKIKCETCGDTGYTASPDYLICKCGGKFKVVAENTKRKKISLGVERPEHLDVTTFIK